MLPFGSIIGRAVFASCPLGTLASCASDPISLSVYNGGIVFTLMPLLFTHPEGVVAFDNK